MKSLSSFSPLNLSFQQFPYSFLLSKNKKLLISLPNIIFHLGILFKVPQPSKGAWSFIDRNTNFDSHFKSFLFFANLIHPILPYHSIFPLDFTVSEFSNQCVSFSLILLKPYFQNPKVFSICFS